MPTNLNDRLPLSDLPKIETLSSVISRASIEARLASLKGERQRVLDNANAYNGAIQECEHWLRLIDGEAG